MSADAEVVPMAELTEWFARQQAKRREELLAARIAFIERLCLDPEEERKAIAETTAELDALINELIGECAAAVARGLRTTSEPLH